ncbi:MAG: FAD-dependent oxidoreductase [Leptolyngbyaceae cyanobacterium bins.59]|nr:FAD-dependent oxidoreductase [Leptolyngbyaceae cyanobacterium bins.59]
MEERITDVLVVGGGVGGTAAAIQAARRGAKTILVSEFPWLGGMLTSAGVSAPDGNELFAFQTGLWGAFLRELVIRQPEGLDHAWVSFFTYEPRIGAEIFADWVRSLPNLEWIVGQRPRQVLKQGNRITGVQFPDFRIQAQITLDGTELGDLLAIGEIPYRWGWEARSQWQEPSAPDSSEIVQKLNATYPVQAPTWVVVMQDFGEGTIAPEIPPPPHYDPALFAGVWEGYGPEMFLNYGRLPGNRFMINWPQQGNDYGEGTERLIQDREAQQEFWQLAQGHSQGFAHFIQSQLGRRYGLAEETFPKGIPGCPGGGAYALHPYYRESRRLQGMVTVREQDLLPVVGGRVAALPHAGDSIAIGNYPNDHHYPPAAKQIYDLKLHPKSIRWGGRWTGTSFTIPYGALVAQEIDGFLVCEKNISVSHMANGATRLQPCVLGIGQAAGMAATLCIEQHCLPRELPVRSLQEALLQDPIAPSAVIPLFNLPAHHPDWLHWQRHYLDHPETYPIDGDAPIEPIALPINDSRTQNFSGIFCRLGDQQYTLTLTDQTVLNLVTLDAGIDRQLQTYQDREAIGVEGRWNPFGEWVLVNRITEERNA